MPSVDKLAKTARNKPKADAKPKQVKKNAIAPVDFKSAEFIESSDEEGKVESVAAAVVSSKANGNGNLKPATSESSEEESEQESGSDEEEESGGDDEMELDDPIPPPATIVKKSSTDPSKSKSAQRPLYSTPIPPSFKPLSISSSKTTAATKLFSKSNLSGKQIWYFSAPSAVPISSIQQISLREGDVTAVKHAGSEYGFVEGTVAEGTNIMVPSASDGGAYNITSKPITKNLRLQLLSRLPGVTTTGPSPHATVPVPKPVRPQPEGMRMRFCPIGVQPSARVRDDEPVQFQIPAAIEDSDVDMAEAAPQASLLKRKHKSSRDESSVKESKKNKRHASQSEPSLEAGVQKPAKKHKASRDTDKQSSGDMMELEKTPSNELKPRKDLKEKNNAEATSHAVENSETPTAVNNGESQERKKKKKDNRVEDPSLAVVEPSSQETKEERKQRKKERKERKEREASLR